MFFHCFQRGGWERGKHQCEKVTLIGCPLVHAPTGDRTWNLGMCLDWELNPQPFGLWDDASTNWATPARAGGHFLNKLMCLRLWKIPSQAPFWCLSVVWGRWGGGSGEDEISPIVWLGHCRLSLILLTEWLLWQKNISLELPSGEAWRRVDQKEGISCLWN